MFHYSPSSRSRDYSSYLPRGSYRPASFDLDDVPSSTFPFEELGYSSLSHPFVPPRVDAETRYRRALYELEAAEQDFEAQVALERARQAVAVRQRAAAEAARLQRVNALYAEIERIKRARALQVQVEEEFGQRQRSFRAPTAFDHANRGERALLRALMNDGAEGVPAHAGFDHAHRGGHPLLRALVGDDAEGAPVQVAFDRAHRGGRGLLRALVHDEAEGVRVPRFFQGRRTCSQRIPSPTRQDNGPLTLGDLLGLIEGHLEPQPTGAPERPTSGSPSQADQPTEPQTQSARAKPIDAEATLGDMLEFFHSFAAKAQGGAGAEQSTHEVRLSIWGVCIQFSNMSYTAWYGIPT
jgi:hypothetical protein